MIRLGVIDFVLTGGKCDGCRARICNANVRTIENKVQPKYHVVVMRDIHSVREGSGVYWAAIQGDV